MNWIGIEDLTEEKQTFVKIRSTQSPVSAIIKKEGEDNIRVVFDELQKSIAIGQSVVFYEDDIVLGGGVINSVA